VAEGLPGAGRVTYPAGADWDEAAHVCIVDPIDGTRGLMYDKRSAWVLAAVAPGPAILGRAPTLADIVVAAQVELPTSRARLADTLWAIAGEGTTRECEDLTSGETRRLACRPSGVDSLAHGFATVSKFFPGTKQIASWLEERLFDEVVGDHAGGAPLVFDDEYVSSGGQLYELLAGHDRFIADLRPAFLAATRVREATGAAALARSGPRLLCARPYDLCTELIAREAGVVVTDEWGRRLSAPLDTASDVAWVGYANEALNRLIEPVLQRLLRELGVPPPT
jgi:fructose-1,6-bisphosphatase/inositol monophosphatase family enzyme